MLLKAFPIFQYSVKSSFQREINEGIRIAQNVRAILIGQKLC